MSTAIASTANRLGNRQLSGYRPRGVYRSPAEARPRAAQSVQNVHLGAVPNGAIDPIDNHIIRIDRTTIYRNGSASQSPTGSVYNSNQHFGTPPAVSPTPLLPPTPTSTAVITPAPASNTLVISSGGGVPVPATESYVTEVEAWLTSDSLLQSLFPSAAIPNWVPLLAGVAFVGMFWGGSGRRR